MKSHFSPLYIGRSELVTYPKFPYTDDFEIGDVHLMCNFLSGMDKYDRCYFPSPGRKIKSTLQACTGLPSDPIPTRSRTVYAEPRPNPVLTHAPVSLTVHLFCGGSWLAP